MFQHSPGQEQILTTLDGVLRRGWVLRGIPHWEGETVREHAENVALAAYVLTGDPTFYHIALMHDAGEIDGKDSTPVCGESDREKYDREFRNVSGITAPMGLEGRRIFSLWHEHASRETLRSHVVHCLDKIDAVVRAVEYDQEDGNGFALSKEFFGTAKGQVTIPEFMPLLEFVYETRRVPDVRNRYHQVLRQFDGLP